MDGSRIGALNDLLGSLMTKLMGLFLFPLLASLAILLFHCSTEKMGRRLAFAMSLVPFCILVFLGGEGWVGQEVDYLWIPSLDIHFRLQVDALSLPFLYLTAVIVPIGLLALRIDSVPYPSGFYALALLLQGLLIGFFTARNLVLFVLFWEAMLLPLYFIIVMRGGEAGRRAALTFMTYMVAGSALMVAAVLALYFSSAQGGSATFDLDALAKVGEDASLATWVGFIFFLAFAVKAPLFPFHAWLPDTYYEAPTAGSILLAALLSKAGVYGFFRVGWGLFPLLLQEWSPWLLGLAIAGVLYGGLAAWREQDYKRLLAYSSFSHLNFVLAGIFVANPIAHAGAILQAFNHGVTIAGLFLVAGWLWERVGSTAITSYGGLAASLPRLCWLTLLFVLSAVAVPGTNGFIGEWLVLFGLYEANPWSAAIIGLTIILSVMYLLRWMQKVYFERPSNEQPSWRDIGGREWAIALPLIALIFWIGIYPAPLLHQIMPAAEQSLAGIDEAEAR